MTQLTPGLYDPTTLPNAENGLLTPFHTTDWAGMSELLTYVDGQHAMFPHFADGLSGYLPDAEHDHPLHRVETVLSGRFENHDRIGLLTFQVGQIVHPEQPRRVQAWERKFIGELMDRKPPFPYEKPNKDWSADDYAELYGAVREAAAARLEEEVSVLAGFIAVQNEVVQLYVQREHGLVEGTGWLGPLLGLAIDTNVEDDYNRQPHDVVPVVGQTDGSKALMRGAGASVYTVATRDSIL